MDNSEEIKLWLRLANTQGIGGQACLKLLEQFGLPEHIFAQNAHQLRQVLSDRQVSALLNLSSTALDLEEKTLKWLESSVNHHVVTLADPNYPQLLLRVDSPPILLYAVGNLALLNQPSIAIVGSRHATAQGKSNAKSFAKALVRSGYCIVSGLALGIDAFAHEGALEASGATIGVVGTGIDIIYPRQNAELAAQMSQRGLVISEFTLGTKPNPNHFPRRNRLIAGLSQGVLVIEAASQSGSLITARLAGDLGREVFAIPGSIHSPLSKGCHVLIKQGAKLVDDLSDILQELGERSSAPRAQAELLTQDLDSTATLDRTSSTTDSPDILGLSELEQQIIQSMGHETLPPDRISQQLNLPIHTIQAALLSLELDGWITRNPAGTYQRVV